MGRETKYKKAVEGFMYTAIRFIPRRPVRVAGVALEDCVQPGTVTLQRAPNPYTDTDTAHLVTPSSYSTCRSPICATASENSHTAAITCPLHVRSHSGYL